MKESRDVLDALVMVLQFGLNMIVPILLCTGLGVWIYRRYGHPMIVIVLFAVGAIAGFQNIYRMAKRIYSRESKRKGRHVKKN